MKIIDLRDPLKRIIDVYAIYWIDDTAPEKHGQRMHLVVPYEGYQGLLAVPEKQTTVVDPLIDGFILRKSGNGSDMLVHWAAEKGDLLDALIDFDPDAMAEFHRRLREDKPSG